MKPSVIWAIATKDLKESAGTSQVLAAAIIVPLVFVVVYPVGMLIGVRYMSAADVTSLFEKIPQGALPVLTGLTDVGKAAYVSTVYLFSAFFLIIPAMIATLLAANSFAGEKERHTLEGLLYTPVSDTELVVGKILGAVIPAIVFSWVCFVVYAIIVNVLGTPLVGHQYFPTLNWWVLMVLVVPAVAVFVTACVVWVSARVATYQAANSIAGLVVLPVLLLVLGQVSGVMIAGPGVFAVLGVALAIADVGLMWWIVKTSDRERMVSSFL
jgi:ABC-2 type transport system permease protein